MDTTKTIVALPETDTVRYHNGKQWVIEVKPKNPPKHDEQHDVWGIAIITLVMLLGIALYCITNK